MKEQINTLAQRRHGEKEEHMNILRNYPENINKRDMYKLTQNSSVQKLSTISGSTITPEQWVLYEDADIKSGEMRKVLVIAADGETFATVSRTFIDSFEKAVDNLGEDLGEIMIASGTSKAGRDYINCEII